jgi:hypothetical protein
MQNPTGLCVCWIGLNKRPVSVNVFYRALTHPLASLLALAGCVLFVPMGLRLVLGWSDLLGYLSDFAIGSLLIVLLHRRPGWLALPVLLAWTTLMLASSELVSAVGRMPTPSDIQYLTDPQFVENSTSGGFAHPWLAAFQLVALALWLAVHWINRSRRRFCWVTARSKPGGPAKRTSGTCSTCPTS